MKIGTGMLFGYLLALLIIAIIAHNNPQTTFKSKKKIKPDYELTTNGKVVDNVWVYKICF